MSGTTTRTVAEYCYRPPFTAVQWQELEHQAMIYKYFVAGIPVPPDLVVPIRRSFEAISARFFHHTSLGYCSYYGKKFDPEPGRCRRTDGKKWRCSKDAYPDSKYCERHMNRGRNRSRKHVESQSTSQSLLTSMSNNATTGSSKISGNFQISSSGSLENMPLYSAAYSEEPNYGSTKMKTQMEPVSYGVDNKAYRYFHGMSADEQIEASASMRSLGMGSNADSTWCLTPQFSSNPMVKPKNDSQLLYGSHQTRLPHPFEPMIDATISKQQQHCFFDSGIGFPGTVKQEERSMRPFFDEWPTAKESWSNLDDEGSNKNNFSSTQLSISIPVAPSDFFSRNSCSPNDV